MLRGLAYPLTLVKDRWPCVGSFGVMAMGLLTAMTLFEVYELLTPLLWMLLKYTKKAG